MVRATVCVVMLLGVAGSAAAFQAEVKKTTKVEAKKADAKVDAKADVKATVKKEVKGRLPANYSKVVDDGQKEKIYAIQADFNARIDAIEAQLKTLTEQRDAAVRAVLTADQQKKLDEIVEEAKSKKSEKTAKKTEESTTAKAAK